MKEQKKNSLLGPVAFVFTAAKTGTWRIEKPKIDQEKCIRCGICSKYCPVEAITVDKDTEWTVLWDYCKGCGICANECPKDCIVMIPEGE